jgi:hypothetical protein
MVYPSAMWPRFAHELIWLGGSILVTSLVLILIALANGAATSLDAFAAFLALVGGVALYGVSGAVRLLLKPTVNRW